MFRRKYVFSFGISLFVLFCLQNVAFCAHTNPEKDPELLERLRMAEHKLRVAKLRIAISENPHNKLLQQRLKNMLGEEWTSEPEKDKKIPHIKTKCAPGYGYTRSQLNVMAHYRG